MRLAYPTPEILLEAPAITAARVLAPKLVGGEVNAVSIPVRGGFVLVDKSDEALVRERSWGLLRSDPTRCYVVTKIRYGKLGQRTVYLHRFLLNAPRGAVVDHVDGNPLNNTRANLRVATFSQNSANRRKGSPASGFRGVYRHKGRWRVCIEHVGKTVRLYGFTSAEDAARAYDELAVNLFGEFATLNFPLVGGRVAALPVRHTSSLSDEPSLHAKKHEGKPT